MKAFTQYITEISESTSQHIEKLISDIPESPDAEHVAHTISHLERSVKPYINQESNPENITQAITHLQTAQRHMKDAVRETFSLGGDVPTRDALMRAAHESAYRGHQALGRANYYDRFFIDQDQQRREEERVRNWGKG